MENKKNLQPKFGCEIQKSITLRYDGLIEASIYIDASQEFLNWSKLLQYDNGEATPRIEKRVDTLQEAIEFLNQKEKEIEEALLSFHQKWKEITKYGKKNKYDILNGTIEQNRTIQVK